MNRVYKVIYNRARNLYQVVSEITHSRGKARTNLTALDTQVKQNTDAIAQKADTTALDTKADKTDLEAKADKTELDAKANTSLDNLTDNGKQVIQALLNI